MCLNVYSDTSNVYLRVKQTWHYPYIIIITFFYAVVTRYSQKYAKYLNITKLLHYATNFDRL